MRFSSKGEASPDVCCDSLATVLSRVLSRELNGALAPARSKNSDEPVLMGG